ncbi:winged helix-turn-helix domain-containing protein [Bradyrhizobium japonicum]|uniref:winged helix-turn-helix domain-containing protein n=1 Tax=Bradyrhizobium japonicum TaxID=375 RepID=UPI001BA7F07C|nr:winged helix-turn-helix domain-containing protein [Bradyrhizobium japonicum]
MLSAGCAIELSESSQRAREVAQSGHIDLCLIFCEKVSRVALELADELSVAIEQVVVASPKASDLYPAEGSGIAVVRAGTPADIAQALQRWLKPDHQHLASAATPAILTFAGLQLDLAAHSLCDRAGRPIPLTASEFLLLSAFANSPERVLSRDQLRNSLDGRGVEVYDRSIDVLVSRLRRKIEKNPKNPTIIVTVPGAGYKFAGPVKSLAADSAFLEPSDAEKGQRVTVGVLPFSVLNSGVELEFFAEGLVDDLIAALTYGAELFVVSRNSSLAYKERPVDVREAGRNLNARYLIDGSVRATGNRLRVLVHLVDTDDGGQVWAKRFDCPFDVHDSLDAQDHLTREIAEAIKRQLSSSTTNVPAEPTRRLVTIIYCRAAVPHNWSAQMGLRDISESLNVFHRVCASAVARFGGRVAASSGECLEIHFGFSGLLERSAELAVRAAILIQDTVRQDALLGANGLSTAIGISTGPAVFNALGQAERSSDSAVGLPVTSARRLCDGGEAGAVVICRATRDLLGGLFQYDLTAPDAYKVLATTDVIYRLEALKGGVYPGMIGRDPEFRQLMARWELARTEEGRSVFISGDAGIGKSRLLAALRDDIKSTNVNVLHFACAPHLVDVALAPIREQIERLAGTQSKDTPEQVEVKLQRVFVGCAKDEIGLLAAELMHAPQSGQVSASLMPQQRKEKLFDLLLAYIVKLAEVSPLLVEFEDLHWSDPATLEFVALLHDRLSIARMLIVLTARPEFRPTWPDTERATELRLTRLDRKHSTKLARDIAGDRPSPAEIERIVDRAEGVPLFIEELARYMVAEKDGGGHDGGDMPLTLEASLLARLDRLPASRPIAEVAAVIGRQFSHEILAIACSQPTDFVIQRLDELTNAGIVFRTGIPPNATYRFRHALLRDAIYNGSDSGTRRALHRRIVLSVERKLPKIVDSQPGLLAFHAFRGELFEKAADYAFRAGRYAVGIAAMREAVGQLRIAVAALSRLPESASRNETESEVLLLLLTALVSAEGYTSPETQATYAQAETLCQKAGSVAKLAAVEHGIFRQYMVEADYSNALKIADDASRAGRPGWELGRGVVTMHLGDLNTALRFLQDASARLDAAGNWENLEIIQVIGAPAYLAMCHALRGETETARLHLNNALMLSERSNHPTGRAFALSTTARVTWLLGDVDRNRATCDELATLCRKHSFRYWLANAECYLGWHESRDGRGMKAAERVYRALDEYRATKARWLYPFFLSIAAEVDYAHGRLRDGLERIDAALQQSADTAECWYDARLLLLKAALLSESKDAAGAEQCRLQARQLIERQGSRLFAF